MATNKTYLPAPDSERYKELVDLFPTADVLQLNKWAKEFGYRNKKNFIDSMRIQYKIERVTSQDGGWEPAEINIPLEIKMGAEPKTAAIIQDFHIPYHDPIAVDLTERLLQEVKPDLIIYPGDVFDFYQISNFDKDPARIKSLQSDINQGRAMFRRHKIMFPDAIKKLLVGNHEKRLLHFLWTKASELSSLTCLTLEELFNLKEYDIELIAYEQGLMINEVFLVLHGEIASIHSGYTAKRMYEKHGGCGICGHCHRLGSYYKRDRFGIWGWWENGCLCHLTPDWIKNPNWVQGFSLVHFHGDRFWVEQVPIIKNKLMYGGKIYE